MSDPSSIVDLRSDTVTKPTPAMRRAMAEAEVGDDVYGEDPTVNRLQARAAEIFEREAALFVPSGSMGNLIAVMCWTRPGMEVICDERGHINVYELASISAIAGCLPRAVAAPDGILTWDLIEPVIAPNVYYRASTGLISLENTSNRHSGNFYPAEIIADICDHAHAIGIPVHLDAARIFNAAVALGRSVADITRKCDSVMSCLSKGLGAPVGSMLLGSKDFIAKARVKRKMLGGGMRQAGILAAAGLVALEESPKQLYVDHENASHLAEGLAQIDGFKLDPKQIRTNIIIFDVQGTGRTAAEISAELAKQGILCGAISKYGIRMVTHHDVDRAGIDRALVACNEIAAQKAGVRHRMKLGDLEFHILVDGYVYLDGGAMFGVIPKTIWEKKAPPDARNRITLAMNCLLIFAAGKRILVETGAGDKMPPKLRDIYGPGSPGLIAALRDRGVAPEDIDIVINTHLHFDHCGGNTRIENGKVVPTFPNAQYFVQKGEFEHAMDPTERDRASYFPENFAPLAEAGKFTFLEGDVPVVPGIEVVRLPGHNADVQGVKLSGGGQTALLFSDLIPMTAHLPLPWIMGYDLYPMTTLENKKKWIPKVGRGGWRALFVHDPKIPAAYLRERDGNWEPEPVTVA